MDKLQFRPIIFNSD